MATLDVIKKNLWHLKPIAFIVGGIGCLWMAANSAYDVGAVQGITAMARLDEKDPGYFDDVKGELKKIGDL